MHVNNYTIPQPPKNLLDQCHQVLISDPAFKMWQMKRWCQEQDLSLVYSEIVETADVSGEFDQVAAFYFIAGKDATAFTLKFK
jgi:hypothetical protein